jgi:hypothetical protein
METTIFPPETGPMPQEFVVEVSPRAKVMA